MRGVKKTNILKTKNNETLLIYLKLYALLVYEKGQFGTEIIC